VRQLRDIQQRARTIWIVYAFPEYMDQALGETIHRECPSLKVFPGTLGAGQVVVCVARAAPPAVEHDGSRPARH
jgi:hypothetical protein